MPAGLPAWQPHLTCLAVDLRSAGASPPDGTPPGLDRHADDLEALRNALRLDSVIPVGCAVGTLAAAAYAARHPGRVPALVLSNPTPRTAGDARAPLSARAAAVRAGGMAAILPGAVERASRRSRATTAMRDTWPPSPPRTTAAYADAVLRFAKPDAAADLPRIRCPTSLAAGRHDLRPPQAHAEEVRRLLPEGTARLEIDEERAHFLPHQQPAGSASRVLDFPGPTLGQDHGARGG
jgi:3-oxoadipate enol-lactonase